MPAAFRAASVSWVPICPPRAYPMTLRLQAARITAKSTTPLSAVQIGKHRPVKLTICGTNEPAFRLDSQTGLPHDSGAPPVMDTIALCLQGAGHTAIPVTGECVLNALDPLKESCVAQAGGRGGACTIIKSATGKLDHLTPPLDPAG